MPSLRDDLGRTLLAQDFEPPAPGRPEPARPATDPARTDHGEPRSDRPGISDQLRQLGYAYPHRARFDVAEQLGAGATARVYAAVDRDLERPIAVKMLVADGPPSAEAVSGFIEEARITASLQHPNVLPVHEVEVNGRGQIFFTMKRVDGRSLGSVLEVSVPGSRLPPLDDMNAVVNVFIGVGHALAYAHRRRVVHQDVKPDNIMLGEFGEVLLVDWGSAKRLDDPGTVLYGTPLYMSPEQARREGADERSDVYCLGATLFHALLLRLPTWSEDVDAFWERKRSGAIDAPTAEERMTAPAALLAIAMKALAARPEERYQQAGDLVEDLRRYQAGLAVTALRESLFQRARRWHGRHKRTFWAWTAAAVVVLALSGALYGERLTQLARWGSPRAETFTSASLSTRWATVNGDFHVDGARLVSDGDQNIITLLDPIDGATAIEFDGEILAGHPAADLSLMWSRGYDPAAGGLARLIDGYCIQFGAWDGAYSGIAVGIHPRETVARCAYRPRTGHAFRARVEIEDNRVRMLVDGREICAWSDPFPLEGGYLSLYAVGPGKAYGDLRIFQREVPARVSAIAIGDEAARGKAYDIAAAAYARIVASHRDDALGREALYKRGLCRWRQGRVDEALATWEPIDSGPFADRVRLHRLEHAFDAGDHDQVFALLPDQYRRADAAGRSQIAVQWGRWIDRVRGHGGHPDLVRRYLDLHDTLMGDQPIADHSAAEALIALERGDELMRRYPDERYLCTVVLCGRGEYDRVIREYPDQRWSCTFAAFSGGMWDAIDPLVSKGLFDEARWMRGRGEDVVHDPDVPLVIRAHALVALGRYEEALAILRADPSWQTDAAAGGAAILALLGLGRLDEAEALSPQGKRLVQFARGDVEGDIDDPDLEMRCWSRAILAMRARAAGERQRARTLLPDRLPPSASSFPILVDAWLLCPLIAGIDDGDFTAFDAACAELAQRWPYIHHQRPALIASFIRRACDDDALRREPCAIYGALDLAFARALRAERERDHDTALAAWRSYLAQPAALRNQQFDAGRDAFVAWRIAELGGK